MILFNPQNDESVEFCLSKRIDLFDDILNNKVEISTIVNKAYGIDCQLNVKQHVIIIQRVLYLRMEYFLVTDLNQPTSFKVCCENAIKNEWDWHQCNKILPDNNAGNRVFRKHEFFSHPNYYVEMGKWRTFIPWDLSSS